MKDKNVRHRFLKSTSLSLLFYSELTREQPLVSEEKGFVLYPGVSLQHKL